MAKKNSFKYLECEKEIANTIDEWAVKNNIQFLKIEVSIGKTGLQNIKFINSYVRGDIF